MIQNNSGSSGAPRANVAGGSRKGTNKPARRRAREFAVQALYQHLVGGNEPANIDEFTRGLSGFAKADSEHFDAVLHGCLREAEAFDKLLTPRLDRKLVEISPIEHAVMWIGLFELLHCPDVPYKVVINECIELAKSFGGTDGHKYVNGVLHKLAPILREAEVQGRLVRFMKISSRAQRIEPFYVMEVAKAATEMALAAAASDKPMIFLNIGEPDFTAPPLVQEAACKAIRDGKTQYTQATGLPALRERISEWYGTRFGVKIPPRRIIVTAGASAALQLACLALLDPGDEVLMPDPSYPCNRHFVSAADARAVLIPTSANDRFQLTAASVERAWTGKSRGVLLASPSNPTGTSIHPDELRRIHQFVEPGLTIIDEIYLGLSYDNEYGHTALALDDQIVSINSFSKYFNMTGWRLGWLVVPDELVSVVERLAQNLYICPSVIAQHAALACFEPESLAEYEQRRSEFKARRDYFIPALNALGLTVPVMPDGAFYAYADCSGACERLGIKDSWEFCFEAMRQAHVAITPGRDFGSAQTAQFVRFSTASSMQHLQQAVARLQVMLS